MPSDRPCVDVNEVLGIYRPEDDATLTDVATSPDASAAAPKRTDPLREPRRVRLGVRIAPKDRQKTPKSAIREASVKLSERSELDAERVTFKSYKGSGKVRDQIVQAGIGLWTKGNLAKFL